MKRTWLLSLLVLTGCQARQSSLSLREYVLRYPQPSCVGLYVNGRKAGYEVVRLHLGQPPEGLEHLREVAWLEVETRTRLDVLGEVNDEQERGRVCYSLQGEGQLLWSEEVKTENGHETVIAVRPQAGGLRVAVTGEPFRQVPYPKDTLQNWLAWETFARDPARKKGDRFQGWQVDWETDPVDLPLNVSWQGRSRFVFQGKPVEAYDVDLTLQGMTLQGQVGPNLLPLKMKAAGMMELIAEPESRVRELGKPARWSDWGLPVSKAIPEPQKLSKLRLRATGTATLQLPSSYRQQLQAVDGGWEITLRSEAPNAPPEPLTPSQQEQYLLLDLSLVCTPEMKDLIGKIAPPRLPPLERASRLQDWVYRHLKKSSQRNAQTAAAVFTQREGDCTEHSLLFLALARQAGIPARHATGCMYAGGQPPFFGWHHWSEIHDGRRWVSMDPTWNQVGVDVTHIKWSEDPKDMSAFNCIGQLQFQLLEASSAGAE